MKYMKSILLMSAMLAFSYAAHADQLKTYDCSAPGRGSVTPQYLTVQADADSIVVSFPGVDVSSVAQTSFERIVTSYAPKGLRGHSGGEYFKYKNGDSFFSYSNQDEYEVLYVFASNGILRQDDSGTVYIYYKETDKNNPSSNRSEWSRAYSCNAR